MSDRAGCAARCAPGRREFLGGVSPELRDAGDDGDDDGDIP